jgi:large subunit ribosomal protein L10
MGTQQSKAEIVDQVRKNFDAAVATVIVNFEGLDVPTVTDLRAQFREAGVEYKVVKNNLIKKALEGSELLDDDALTSQLKGMTAVAWSFEDPSSAAKIIKKFRKDGGPVAERLEVKCGVLDGQVLDGARVENELATLPGKDELRAQLLAQLMAPAQNLVRQLLAPGQNLAFALDARKRQLEEQG